MTDTAVPRSIPPAPTLDDIRRAATASAMPATEPLPSTATREYFQAIDNMIRVFAIRPGERVLFLTDPRLDRRVVDAIAGIAASRGATTREFMAPTSQLTDVPEDAKPALAAADFVVSTWFCSTGAPYCNKLRKEQGQRWVKITYFRNLDVLHTPQARFPVDLVGDIVRATANLYPRGVAFDMRFTDPRGSDLSIRFTPEMTDNLLDINRWRGECRADEPGCYIHYLPTHGPNLYGEVTYKRDPNGTAKMEGIVYPQWAVGFPRPFEEKIGIEYKDTYIVKVHGHSREADVLREMLVGARLHELGCGHNPKAPRFSVYPAGSNAPGALHFGTDGRAPSPYLRRVIPYWEEPHVHQDCAIFDATVKAGNTTIIDNGFLMSLRDPAVVAAAASYGDPIELLEAFVE
jgi:hypothetical protein